MALHKNEDIALVSIGTSRRSSVEFFSSPSVPPSTTSTRLQLTGDPVSRDLLELLKDSHHGADTSSAFFSLLTSKHGPGYVRQHYRTEGGTFNYEQFLRELQQDRTVGAQSHIKFDMSIQIPAAVSDQKLTGSRLADFLGLAGDIFNVYQNTNYYSRQGARLKSPETDDATQELQEGFQGYRESLSRLQSDINFLYEEEAYVRMHLAALKSNESAKAVGSYSDEVLIEFIDEVLNKRNKIAATEKAKNAGKYFPGFMIVVGSLITSVALMNKREITFLGSCGIVIGGFFAALLITAIILKLSPPSNNAPGIKTPFTDAETARFSVWASQEGHLQEKAHRV